MCISSLIALFSPQLSCLECGPGDNKSLWCLCVCQRGGGRGRQKERQRESRAGSWVKGGDDPGGAQGSRWRYVSREGVVFLGGGSGFNRDVKHDKDGPDRPSEWSRRDRTAILGIQYTAPSTVVTPSAPLFLILSTPPPCYINLFLRLAIKAEGQFDMSELDVRVYRCVKLPFGNHTSG